MKFSQNGDMFRLTAGHDQRIHDTLPGGNYTVMSHPDVGYYLNQAENFELPSKIYGQINRQRDRIIGTFLDRASSTGALLAGEKGSGKSLLAKAISTKLAKSDIPTLIVNNPFSGDDFSTFLAHITQPICMMFDEFEKVYSDMRGHQNGLLTLMDGVYTSKRLFLLTCNDKYAVNNHMKNRPGRLFYMLEFKGLDSDFVKEYATDNLREGLRVHVPKLVALADSFEAFNFDMLKATIEEMNRYSEAPKDALSMLNIKPDSFSTQRYGLKLLIDGKEVPKERMLTKVWRGNPAEEFRLTVQFKHILPTEEVERQRETALETAPPSAKKDEVVMERYITRILGDLNVRQLAFTRDDFKRMDAVSRTLIYVKGEASEDQDDGIDDYEEPLTGFKQAELRLIKLDTTQVEDTSPYEYL